MTLDLRRIVCAKDLKDTAKGAMKVVDDALAPRLEDRSLIAEMYEHFRDYVKGQRSPHHSEKRREFLFIVAYFYFPSVLIGGTMPKGFRSILKGVLNVESPSAISNYVADLLFLYNHYLDFRQTVEGAYSHIVCSMHLDV